MRHRLRGATGKDSAKFCRVAWRGQPDDRSPPSACSLSRRALIGLGISPVIQLLTPSPATMAPTAKIAPIWLVDFYDYGATLDRAYWKNEHVPQITSLLRISRLAPVWSPRLPKQAPPTLSLPTCQKKPKGRPVNAERPLEQTTTHLPLKPPHHQLIQPPAHITKTPPNPSKLPQSSNIYRVPPLDSGPSKRIRL